MLIPPETDFLVVWSKQTRLGRGKGRVVEREFWRLSYIEILVCILPLTASKVELTLFILQTLCIVPYSCDSTFTLNVCRQMPTV